MTAGQGEQSRTAIIRSSTACVECRSRHMKCDATRPTCHRCVRDGTTCVYLRSRRGGNRKRRLASTSDQLLPTNVTETPTATGNDEARSMAQQQPTMDVVPNNSALAVRVSEGSSSTSSFITRPVYEATNSPANSSQQLGVRDSLLEMYFTYFHTSHPCVAPLRFLRDKIASHPSETSLLVNVLQFIGSLYAEDIASEPFENAILLQIPNWGPFEVQAVLLYAVAVYWRLEIEKGRILLDLAISKAVDLGMNDASFAIRYSPNDPVFAESWRRTWWELYLCDGHMAGATHAPVFSLSQRLVKATVGLPCEENDYNEGYIPNPKTLEQYDDREFEDEDLSSFSSYAYLVGLVRTLDGHVIGVQVSSEERAKQMCTNADNGMAAWLSLLPKWKRSCLTDNGNIDYLILRAHTCIYVYMVDRHRYLSTLKYYPIESVSTCAPPPPPDRLAPIYEREAPIHTKKILLAITKWTELMTLPIQIPKLSPFTICMTAGLVIAHLAACRTITSTEELDLAREQIRVNMGIIETFSEVWSRAAKISKEVKTIAKDTFRGRSNISTISNSPASATSSSVTSGSDSSGAFSMDAMNSLLSMQVGYFPESGVCPPGFDSGFDPALASLFNMRSTDGVNDV